MRTIAVIIPTYQRPAVLARCVAALARQTLEAEAYEVLVGLDGPDARSGAEAERAWAAAGGRAGGLAVVECPRRGLNATRNALLAGARARLMVSMNDDVVAEPGFLRAHAVRHARAEAARPGVGAIVSGWSPFAAWPQPTLFDRLCDATSMLFFYDQMVGRGARAEAAAPEHDWGFRHCYGLNFSCELELARSSGGFVAFPLAYGYDDIEMAFRLTRVRPGMPVLFCPEARATHEHRYTPRDVIERERKLGASAWHFAGERPEFCHAVFGRDVRAPEELAYSREFVRRERALAERLERSFLSLEEIPASAVEGQGEARAWQLVQLVYEQHLLLKRWHWRRGLLEAAERGAMTTSGA